MNIKLTSKDIKQIKETLSVYYHSTGINCRAIRIKDMTIINCPDCDQTPAFCQLVHGSDKGKNDCYKSSLYGGRQAEKLGEYYIYFCPYGLINWAVPIIRNKEMEYFAVGGPTLMHPVDDLLLENIYKYNPSLKENSNDIKRALNKLPYVDPIRTRYLADLLMRITKSNQNPINFEEKKKNNSIGAYLAETIHELKRKNDFSKKNILYPIEKENELISKVKSGDNEGARLILNQLLGHIYFNNGNKFDIVKAKSIELMAVLSRAAIEIGADLEIIFGLEYMLYENLNDVKDINELSEGLAKILDRFIEATFIISNVKNNDIIYKAMNYIRNSYFNKNITLNDVADEVGLSTSYFSKLFKDKLGMSYTDYLNKVRIAASKQLLKKGIPIIEIAQTVGFNDQSYFSKVFKKNEGVSPGNYK